MPLLKEQLELERCPHCNVDKPSIHRIIHFETTDYKGESYRFWRIYKCIRCGGAIIACSDKDGDWVQEIYPSSANVDETIPEKARNLLSQALNSLHSPAGSVMLSASSVDAMLKAKGYKDGSLYSRIDKAKDNHLITEEMALWAHEVRLDANDQRHADEEAPLPNEANARKCVDFVLALGQFLFVLPARVQRGIEAAKT